MAELKVIAITENPEGEKLVVMEGYSLNGHKWTLTFEYCGPTKDTKVHKAIKLGAKINVNARWNGDYS